MYAGADFLLMPSRVEPCGLNQMYAMRYGTVPIVRRTGGLKDTVIDYGDPGGYGVCFTRASVGDITHAIYRAIELYSDKEKMKSTRMQIMELDNSWDRSAQQYIDVYESIVSKERKLNGKSSIGKESPVQEEINLTPVSPDPDEQTPALQNTDKNLPEPSVLINAGIEEIPLMDVKVKAPEAASALADEEIDEQKI